MLAGEDVVRSSASSRLSAVMLKLLCVRAETSCGCCFAPSSSELSRTFRPWSEGRGPKDHVTRRVLHTGSMIRETMVCRILM